MIGVFDSGIGGLTVVRALMECLPGYDVLYFGDTARMPYGSKSPSTVVKYAIENTEFLLSEGAQAVVLACNTASSVAPDILRRRYDVPFFEVITPAAEMAVQSSRKGRIGIIGTRATVASGVYEAVIQNLRPEYRVFASACPLLVPLVEEGWFHKPETAMIVKKYLRPLKTRQIDTLILGCTHYPLLTDLIQAKIGRRVRVIDSSTGVASSMRNLIEQDRDIQKHLKREGRYRFFVSDTTPQFENIARAILKRPIQLQTYTG
jgi:glutamate racemase